MKLKNRIAIVTGAARGIGLACAERLAAEGATDGGRMPLNYSVPARE